ncbi:MAG TPA: COR domain-containing protein [Verrucomicrobiae bacterium]
MSKNDAYRRAEKLIEKARLSGAKELSLSPGRNFKNEDELTELPETLGQLNQLQKLDLSGNQLTALPKSLGELWQLQVLNLSKNRLTSLPESLGQLTQLRRLNLCRNVISEIPVCIRSLKSLQSFAIGDNQITEIPEWLGDSRNLVALNLGDDGGGNPLAILPTCIRRLTNLEEFIASYCGIHELPDWLQDLTQLQVLYLTRNKLSEIPPWIGQLKQLTMLRLEGNDLADIPSSIVQLPRLRNLNIYENPLNPELAAADKVGFDAVLRYLRAKEEAQIALNEAKLILVGEGEVGKSCLLGALRGDSWEEDRDTTHGIEIKPVKVTSSATGKDITLNGWDFGGQRVYRPTHQLFFSAPAVYLVVWKPREGSQAGAVKEWMKLVKHREPDAKILVVATHGGPNARQPDIDRQEIWDLFGKETVVDFFFVDSKGGQGIAELKEAIANVAAVLPEMGRSVPKSWYEARVALKELDTAYIPTPLAIELCAKHKMNEEDARLFLTIEHALGRLIYYTHDPLLKDIVILKPDWLATAISFVLDDKQTRDAHGLVSHERLRQLWSDAARVAEQRYPMELHPVFLKLMERYDLCYRIAEGKDDDTEGTRLIAQLVPDVKPMPIYGWADFTPTAEHERVQICRIIEEGTAQSATAEGLFYLLIVRLHKYSLGRVNFANSSHWQRGLVLDDNYNGRALLEHIGNDVKIVVRAVYPEAFLSVLTHEVKWLVENFWRGLRCDVMVPCIEPCGRKTPGNGLFEVEKLIESKRKQRPEYPCAVCNEWQNIDCLLRNAPAAHANPMAELLMNSMESLKLLEAIRSQLGTQHVEVIGRFDQVDAQGREIVSKVEVAYSGLMQALLDEAKEGPRLFSFEPVEPRFFDRPKWVNAKFKLTLWCEHSRRPLWYYSDGDPGVYTIDLPREWLLKAAPFLRILSTTLSLVLPVVAAGAKVALPDADYKGIEAQLALGKVTAESLLKVGEKTGEWLATNDGLDFDTHRAIRAEGGVLRQLHVWLKEKDPAFGGLVRVQNKRQEFLWVHRNFEIEY